ncbi:MAG: PAS domain S-box protein [Bacteroidia bacterium]|nr:PAS domain S-box protein [Bacteroidia bacterium]
MNNPTNYSNTLEQSGKSIISIPDIGISARFLKGFVYIISLKETRSLIRIEGNSTDVTGYSPEELLNGNITIESLIIEEDRNAYLAKRQERINNSSSDDSVKFRIKHRNIGTIQVAERIIIENDAIGNPEYLIGYVEDKTVENLNALSMRQLLAFREAIDRFLICTITDRDGVIIYANRKFSRQSGYTIKEILGQTHGKLIGSEHHDESFWQQYWKTISAGEKWTGIVQNVAKSGKKYWEEKVVIPITDSNGEIVNYLSLSNDVTSRFELERKLRFFKEAIDVSPDMMFLIDLGDFRILDINSTATRTLGYTPSRLLEMSFPSVLVDITENELRFITEEAIKISSGKGVIETRMKTSEGVNIDVDLVYSVYHSVKWGHRVIFSARDVTMRKELKRELESHKTGMMEIARLAQMGTWEWRPHEEIIILSANAASILEVGDSETTITFAEFQKMIHPADLHILDKAIERIFDQEEPAAFNYRIATAGGAEKHLSLKRYNLKISSDNRIVSVQGFAQDITEIRLTQIENEYYHDKLEQLVFQTSHHLRASVSTILGVLEVFKAGKPSHTEVDTLLKYISDAAIEADDNLRIMFRRLQEAQSHRK